MLVRLKLIATSLVAASVIAPPALHHSANGYLRAERYVLATVDGWKLKGLRAMGLQPVMADLTVDELVERASEKYGIDPKFARAVATHESNDQPTAYSIKGAIGIMQVMPANATKRCGLSHAGKLWDEATNIDCGVRILSEELATYKGNKVLALKAYNGGHKCAVVHKCSESEAYVDKVVRAYGKTILR